MRRRRKTYTQEERIVKLEMRVKDLTSKIKTLEEAGVETLEVLKEVVDGE